MKKLLSILFALIAISAYAKYDFAPMFENGVQMKLWLASKRGDEE